jgi:polyhydroxybutyrate depolymerase
VGAVVALSAAVLLAGCSSDGQAGGAATTSTAREVTTTSVPAGTGTSTGCGRAGTPGDVTRTLTSGGLEREFILHLPPDAATEPDRPRPLVLDLHGYIEGMVVHAAVSQMAALADREDVVVVTPNGTGDPVFWNATQAPGVVDDIAFIGDLLDHVEAETCLDLARVYAMGLSNGGFMSSRLACTMSDRIAAVAPVAGVMVWDDCTPARPVPVLAIHGDADPIVSFDGSVGEGSATLPMNDTTAAVISRLDLRPVPAAAAAWADRNGCDGEVHEERVASDVVRSTYGCDADAEVQLLTIEGGGHSWPGSTFLQGASDIVGRTSMSISASEEIWKFFADHPMPRAG